MNRIAVSFASIASFVVLAACAKSPDEITPSPAAASPNATSSATSAAAASSPPPATPATGAVVQHGGEDPLGGKFTLADATKGLAGTGPLTATITTSMGALSCKLYDDKAPNTVANFVGLARGIRPWKAGGDWVKRPSYDGTTFHRIIKGFMIQGGDPEGTGRGEPGYVINDEIWPGAKHDRAGQLCMANRGHNTNGQQIFITDAAASYLDGNYTIFGECSPEQTIHDLAAVPVTGDHPNNPPLIKSVTITRGAPSK
jgi:peptidyl-prolyl cis-trans isomerase A (cyclophilin A)